METIIEVKNLTKQYNGSIALNRVNLSVKRGAIYGLVGANGAGKTTLLKILAGQSFLNEGEFSLFGAYRQREQEKQRGRIGAMIEQPGFYPQLSVEQNLEYYRLQKGIPGKKCVEDALKTVGMWEVRRKKGKELSLGMKQRVGMAIALLGEPELLLLDEPINGLDPNGIIEMRHLLKKLNREKRITIVISSHILSELEQLATAFGFLEKGQLREQLSYEELQEKNGSYLEIIVTDTERYTVLLEKQLGHTGYLVTENQTIRILEPEAELEKYSALASENGIGIRGMALKQNTLEEYYLRIKGEGKRDA